MSMFLRFIDIFTVHVDAIDIRRLIVKVSEMLEFVVKAWKVEVRRKNVRDCVALITEDLEGYWGLHLQTCKVLPDELRQIADKLDELNKGN